MPLAAGRRVRRPSTLVLVDHVVPCEQLAQAGPTLVCIKHDRDSCNIHKQGPLHAAQMNRPQHPGVPVLTELVSKFRSTTASGNRRASPVKVFSAIFTFRASERPPRLPLHISAALLMISSISTQGSGHASSFCQFYNMGDLESEPCLAAVLGTTVGISSVQRAWTSDYTAKHVIAIGITRERSKALTSSFSTWNLLTTIVLCSNVGDKIITRSRQVEHSF